MLVGVSVLAASKFSKSQLLALFHTPLQINWYLIHSSNTCLDRACSIPFSEHLFLALFPLLHPGKVKKKPSLKINPSEYAAFFDVHLFVPYIHAHLHKVKTSSCCIAVAKLARQSHCKSNNNNTTKTKIYKW